MQSWVKEKLKVIDELFPAERITKSKERWGYLWTGEGTLDRYPFVYAPVTINYYDDVFTKEEGLRAFLDEFIIRGRVEDDFIPAFFPGCKQGTIPNMFGSKEIVKGKDHTCERILLQPEDIDQLPEPSVAPGTIAHQWLEMQAYYLDQTEGRIPVHVADMQGPLDVCGQLWGYDNILAAPYEEPEAYHKLMSKVTEAFILFWEKQKALLGKQFIGTHLFGWDWVPENSGASLSADSMVMMSPGFFDDYCRPYIEKIGNTFGGLTVHSCGNFSAVTKNLCALPCLKAVNAAQMSIEQLLEAGFDTAKVIIANAGTDNIDVLFKKIKTHRLRGDFTLHGLWPAKDGKTTDPKFWTESEWSYIREKEQRIMEAAIQYR